MKCICCNIIVCQLNHKSIFIEKGLEIFSACTVGPEPIISYLYYYYSQGAVGAAGLMGESGVKGGIVIINKCFLYPSVLLCS